MFMRAGHTTLSLYSTNKLAVYMQIIIIDNFTIITEKTRTNKEQTVSDVEVHRRVESTILAYHHGKQQKQTFYSWYSTNLKYSTKTWTQKTRIRWRYLDIKKRRNGAIYSLDLASKYTSYATKTKRNISLCRSTSTSIVNIYVNSLI